VTSIGNFVDFSKTYESENINAIFLNPPAALPRIEALFV